MRTVYLTTFRKINDGRPTEMIDRDLQRQKTGRSSSAGKVTFAQWISKRLTLHLFFWKARDVYEGTQIWIRCQADYPPNY